MYGMRQQRLLTTRAVYRCEERFEDHLASCVYNAYLAGANLWISHSDFAVRTGQEPADTLYTPQVSCCWRQMQIRA